MENKGKPRTNMTQFTKALILLLKKEVEGLGFSSKEIAYSTGISEPTLSRIFKFTRVLDVAELEAICAFLHLRMSAVVAEAEASLRKPSSSSPSALSEVEAYAIAEELDRKLRAGMTPEQLGLAAKTRETDPLDTRGEESQIPPDWDE